MVKSSLEKAWLFHEIGRCYLELNKAEAAQSYGQKSLQSANEEGDAEWQLHATLLVAEAQGKGVRDGESHQCQGKHCCVNASVAAQSKASHRRLALDLGFS